MKNNKQQYIKYILIITITIITIYSCSKKEYVYREPTRIIDQNKELYNNLPYTRPSCILNSNTTRSSFNSHLNTNFNTNYSKSKMNDSVTVIQFSNSNNDQIIFYINNLNPNSANFNVINKKDINTNDAFISIKARNTSSINKNNYQSRAGTIHIRYEDSTKTWYLNLCNQAIIDILSLYNYEFDGYFVFK